MSQLIITYFFHGRDQAKNLVQNCINCEVCKAVCASAIDLPRLIKEVHAKIQDDAGHPLTSLLLGKVLKNRKLFHTLLRSAQVARKPVTLEFPADQSCCGLPVVMMGEKKAARDVARQNMAAMEKNGCDTIVTLCASWASHLKTVTPNCSKTSRIC